MRSLKDDDLKGKIVFLRADFNVPIDGEKITDDFRIKKALPLINYLKSQGTNIILSSHRSVDDGTLVPVYEYLKNIFPINFCEDYFPQRPNFQEFFDRGEIVLLENIRKYKEEKANDENFSSHLASFADIYINEAFPESHRSYSSIIGIPRYIPSYPGPLFEQEVSSLSKAFKPDHPFLFVLGGAKFETKIPLLKKFFTLADKVFVGGALANDFFKSQGLNVGQSVVSDTKLDLTSFFNEKLVLPTDVCVKNANGMEVKKPEEILDGDKIVDIGPNSIDDLCTTIENSKFILWNGPLGHFEMGFKDGTLHLAKHIAGSRATTVVGGGDTLASIAELNLGDKFTFVSTAGGAMLDFLANETLPGIEALS